MNNLDSSVVKQNALILSNASALANAIIVDIGEQNISKSINGESLTRDRIEQMIAMKLVNSIKTNL